MYQLAYVCVGMAAVLAIAVITSELNPQFRVVPLSSSSSSSSTTTFVSPPSTPPSRELLLTTHLALRPCFPKSQRCAMTSDRVRYEEWAMDVAYTTTTTTTVPTTIVTSAQTDSSIARVRAVTLVPRAPPVVSSGCKKRCDGIREPMHVQLTSVLAALHDDTTTTSTVGGIVGYTIVDRTYAPQIAAYHHMLASVDMDRFFYVTLDVAAALECCRLGVQFVRFEVEKRHASLALKQVVGISKFYTAELLARRGVTAWFAEMDVFFRRPFRTMLTHVVRNFAISFPTHYNNPRAINIGMWVARGDNTTMRFFDTATKHMFGVVVWDQKLIQVLSNGRRDCEDFPIIAPRPPPPSPSPSPTKPKAKTHVCGLDVPIGRFPSSLVNCGDTIVMSSSTAVVHVLTNTPLTDARKKYVRAKYLQVWPDYDGYYSSSSSGGGGVTSGFLALDNLVYDEGGGGGVHTITLLKWHLVVLVALARLTNRALILPMGFVRGAGGRGGQVRYAHYAQAAMMVDVNSIEEIGVEWRDSGFLANDRVTLDVVTPTRTLVLTGARDCVAVGEWTNDGRPPSSSSSSSSCVRAANGDDRLVDLFVAALQPQVTAAKLVLLRTVALGGGKHAFWGRVQDAATNKRTAASQPVAALLANVYKRLRFCAPPLTAYHRLSTVGVCSSSSRKNK